MSAVRQIQLLTSRHAFEKERHKHNFVFVGESPIRIKDLSLILRAHARRRVHAAEQDLRVRTFRAFDHLVQILAQLADGLTAQDVVRAEFDDDEAHRARVVRERPVDAVQAAARRVAGNSGVDYFVVITVALQHRLQKRRVALRRGQTVTGGQAVAEGNDLR